jgi:hypothetical protein
MGESEPHSETQQDSSGNPERDGERETHRPRWLVGLLLATSLLLFVAVAAYFALGRELFQRPFLIVVVVSAWLGALVGISVGHRG